MNNRKSTTILAIIISILVVFGVMLILQLTRAVDLTVVPSIFWDNKYGFLRATGITLFISVAATFLGVLLGFIFAIIKNLEVTPRDSYRREIAKRTSKSLVTIYVDVVRGTPMMVQALILSSVIFRLSRIEGILVAILIVFLNTTAYATEVIRSGINGIDKGELEAARSLGMTHFQSMRHIILPQAFRNSVPAIGNELIVNVKDTSVLSVIGTAELMFFSRQIVASTYNLDTYIVTAMIYLVCTKALTTILQLLVNRLDSNKSKSNMTFPTSQTMPEVLN